MTLPTDPIEFAEHVSRILLSKLVEQFPKEVRLAPEIVAPLLGLKVERKDVPGATAYNPAPVIVEPIPGFGELDSYLLALLNWLEQDGLVSRRDPRQAGYTAAVTRSGLMVAGRKLLPMQTNL